MKARAAKPAPAAKALPGQQELFSQPYQDTMFGLPVIPHTTPICEPS